MAANQFPLAAFETWEAVRLQQGHNINISTPMQSASIQRYIHSCFQCEDVRHVPPAAITAWGDNAANFLDSSPKDIRAAHNLINWSDGK
jgi:hypothetical protein